MSDGDTYPKFMRVQVPLWWVIWTAFVIFLYTRPHRRGNADDGTFTIIVIIVFALLAALGLWSSWRLSRRRALDTRRELSGLADPAHCPPPPQHDPAHAGTSAPR